MNISRFAPVLGLLVLAGCGGGGSTAPAPLCATPVLPTLVSPLNGATGVSASIGVITFTNVVPGDVFTINGTALTGVTQLAPVPSALPLPNTGVVPIPALAAHTLVQITLVGNAPDPCTSATPLSAATLVNVVAQIGSFTTQ